MQSIIVCEDGHVLLYNQTMPKLVSATHGLTVATIMNTQVLDTDDTVIIV